VIVPVCVEVDEDNWDTRFLEELGNDHDCEEVAGRDSNDEDDTADQEEPPKLTSYKEVVVALEEVS